MHNKIKIKISGAKTVRGHDAGRRCPSGSGRQAGAILLEVVLALVLFAAAAAIIGAGLNASISGLERLRLNTHAADIAVSVLSELQLGIKSLTVSGPQACEAPLQGWTWEAVATPMQAESRDSGHLKMIEVIVRHDEPPTAYRLSQIVRVEEPTSGGHAL